MSVLESLFGLTTDDPSSKFADQLMRRYMLAQTEKDVADRGLDMVFGGEKTDEVEHRLDIAIKKRQLGLHPDMDEFDEPSALRRIAPYAAIAGGASLLGKLGGSKLLGSELSTMFGGKTGGLTPHFKDAFAHGGTGPDSVISDLLRRRG